MIALDGVVDRDVERLAGRTARFRREDTARFIGQLTGALAGVPMV